MRSLVVLAFLLIWSVGSKFLIHSQQALNVSLLVCSIRNHCLVNDFSSLLSLYWLSGITLLNMCRLFENQLCLVQQVQWVFLLVLDERQKKNLCKYYLILGVLKIRWRFVNGATFPERKVYHCYSISAHFNSKRDQYWVLLNHIELSCCSVVTTTYCYMRLEADVFSSEKYVFGWSLQPSMAFL